MFYAEIMREGKLEKQSQISDFLSNHGLLPSDTRPDSQHNLRIPCIDECTTSKHNKSTLSINMATGQFQCFRCGWSGSWRKFQRRFEPPTPEEVALATSQELFTGLLKNVKDLLIKRGLTQESLQTHGIGYAPSGYLEVLLEQGVKIEALLSTGLAAIINQNGDDTVVETLANRITIPYFAADGSLYSFKARTPMDEDLEATNRPKYKNAAGVSFTGPYNERAIRKSGDIYVTEGEFDAIVLLQNGLNACGLPGAKSLRSEWFTGTAPIFIFDADQAGRDGFKRAIKQVEDCRAIFLPDGYDVSSFVSEMGFDAFREYVNTAENYVSGVREESDNLGFRISQYDDWAYSNGDIVGAETGFDSLTNAIDGWQSGLYILPAGSNIGKSSFAMQLADMAIENNDDTLVVFLSLDDSERVAFTKLLSYKANITYMQAMKPRHELVNSEIRAKNRPDILARRQNAINRLKKMHSRFIIRDIRFGRTLASFERTIKKIRRNNLDKKIIVVIDSFDKMTLSADALQNTDSKGSLIQEIKRITTEQDITVLTPAETRKIGDARPQLSDIKDTVQVEYEADVVFCLFQALHHNPNTTLIFEDEEGNREPILEVWVKKNKKSFFKNGPLLFYFHSRRSRFEEIPEDKRDYYRKLIQEDMAPKGKK